ncbi:hypothetical protein MP228_003147 [Amoeboaphelidium protococcarum]|nr:hypothetical protein MP228_003147 [Amoeboaphelidium protococcarum]
MTFVEWLRNLFVISPIDCQNPHHDPYTFGLSVVIAVGMAVSYLPQHAKIIMNRSSKGLSGIYLFMGAIAMISLLSNTLLLQFGHLRCCSAQSAGQCLENIMAIIQIGIQFFCFMLYVFLFVYYFPLADRYVTNIESLKSQITHQYRKALFIGLAVASYLVINLVVTLSLLLSRGDASQDRATEYWADGNGILSMILSAFQFIPQIFKTYRQKQIGALSMPTMLMQIPGAFILVYTLATRQGSNVTNWITFLCTGTLQSILFILCLSYYIRDYRAGKLEESESLLQPVDLVDDDEVIDDPKL